MAMNSRLAPGRRTMDTAAPGPTMAGGALDAMSQNPAVQNTQNRGLGGNALGAMSGGSSAPSAPGPTTDPTQFTFTDADNTQADDFTQGAIDKYNSTEDWTKQASLNALSGSQRLASENSARAGYSPFGASAGANRSAGLVQGINAMNSMMANWAKGGSQLMMGAAAGARNQAQFTSQGTNNANWANTQQAINNVQNQQQTNAAADTMKFEAAKNLYEGKKGWTSSSAAANDWSNASQAYADAMKSGDPAAVRAALAQLTAIAEGSNYTADGHNRNDPALKDRGTAKKGRDGVTRWFKDGKVVATETPDGVFRYTGE